MKLFHETELLSSFFWWPFLQCLLCELEQEWNSFPPSVLCSSSPVSHDKRYKASRSLAALTVSVWGMSQILVPAQYYDSKYTTPGSTKIPEHSYAMVSTPRPSLPVPLSMSLSTLPHKLSFPPQGQCSPWHRSKRMGWRQISSCAFRGMTSTGSYCIPKM